MAFRPFALWANGAVCMSRNGHQLTGPNTVGLNCLSGTCIVASLALNQTLSSPGKHNVEHLILEGTLDELLEAGLMLMHASGNPIVRSFAG